ncbi:ABC transporter ATP-binding protein [Compostibacillus humi]|uniref:ABC transporter ATP-binding protein n=1 Tax=Compostibacillus humi TaxID=1245525 RepID=A0A8J2ZT98_9BACI|nr:ABC transporter ATP-binding protein [Compostibacillus humi]GGH75881.1 ABC transporter ATP-binding protein [Compostibacillus humi]
MLTLNGIYKNYGKKTVLSNISLQVSKGICLGLVGPNGAGKSTLIKIIASIIQDYRGELRFSDSVRIGYVPQDISLEETVSAKDNLQFFGRLYGLSGKALKERISEVLKEIGLEKREKDKVQTFSGGMKRRLNIGCAILHEPDLIIMDEPTVGIDPQSRQHIFQMVDRFREAGKTIIYASHYMEEIERLCDEAAFIDHGKIVENGTIQQILQKHAVPSIFVKGGNALPDKINEFGSVAAKNGGYIVQTNRPLDAMEFVLQFYKEKNDQLERLELVQPILEDVFFSLTGKELRD